MLNILKGKFESSSGESVVVQAYLSYDISHWHAILERVAGLEHRVSFANISEIFLLLRHVTSQGLV